MATGKCRHENHSLAKLP